MNLIFRQCITSVDYAQNMIVVKTMPGLANGAASAIDKLNIPEMLGTLAGDDTCFVVLKDTQARCRALRRDPGADRALSSRQNRRKTDAFYPAY